MRRLRTRRWLVLAVMVTCAACFFGDPSNPSGATLIDGRPAVVATLCKGEGVDSVFITDSASQDGEGPTVWRIDAANGPVRRDTFVIGDVPEGFTATTPLAGNLPRRELTAWVITDSGVEMVNAVDFRKVEEGKLYLDTEPVSREHFRNERFCS
jgi:hypothetical protein